MSHPKQTYSFSMLSKQVSSEFEHLLKLATPRPLKKHQLIKILSNEEVPYGRSEIDLRLKSFFNLPFERRTTQRLAQTFKVLPYPWLANEFFLNFQNGEVSAAAILQVAKKLDRQIKLVLKPPPEIANIEMVTKVINSTLNPRPIRRTRALIFLTLPVNGRKFHLKCSATNFYTFLP